MDGDDRPVSLPVGGLPVSFWTWLVIYTVFMVGIVGGQVALYTYLGGVWP